MRLILVVIAWLIGVVSASAGTVTSSCDLAKSRDWTPQEQWTWDRICAGLPADFNVTPQHGGHLDPVLSGSWPKSRVLREGFLRAVLYRAPYKEAVPHQGVVIRGAWFPAGVDLSDGIMIRPLVLDGCRFDAGFKAQRIKTDRYISLQRSSVAETLDLNFSSVDQVALGRTHLGGLSVVGATLNNQFVVVRARIDTEANFFATKVEQTVFFNEAIFGGPLKMDQTVVKGNVNLLGSQLRSVTLAGARVDGALLLGPNQVKAYVERTTRWHGADAMLVLRDAQIGSLNTVADPNVWPPRLDLAGLKYTRFSRIPLEGTSDPPSDFLDEPIEWYLGWLRKSLFSTQPYQHLADVLKVNGYPERAQRILYESKNEELARARCHVPSGLETRASCRGESGLRARICRLRAIVEGAGGCVDKSARVLSWIFIGHGYRLYYVLPWMAALIATGAVVLSHSREGRLARMPYGIAYSVDALVPLVTLRPLHKEIDLRGWQRYYFYFHRVMGYLLATFLAAGLAGLTK